MPATAGHTQLRQPHHVAGAVSGIENSIAASTPLNALAVIPSPCGVVCIVQPQHHVEAVLRRKLLDQPAHLAVADDREFSVASLLACSVEHLRIELREELLVQRGDGRHQVLLRNHEAEIQQRAPWEIMRIFISSSTWNARPATPGV